MDVFFDPDADPVATPRAAVVCLDPEARACTFDEVELSWNLDTACAEAKRCLRCDYGKIPVAAATAPDRLPLSTRRGEVMPVLTVDDIKVEVPEGTSLLDACRQAGANIPTLCYLEGVQAIGACRLCLVEVEGAQDPRRLVRPAGHRRHGGARPTRPAPAAARRPSSSCSSPSTTATARPASAAPTASCAAWPLELDIDEITYEGEKTRKIDRHLHPGPGARHRQVRRPAGAA